MSLTQNPAQDQVRNGGLVTFEGEDHLCIAGYDRLPPFLMSIPSDTDLWMYVSSAGGLTAGRTDPDGSLFPYVTEDQLHDAHHHTGPVTMLRVRRAGRPERLWEPFTAAGDGDPAVERNLYKHPLGTPLVFEEIHRGLGLAFRYRWGACDEFGHVRTATLVNLGDEPVAVTLLDGLRNILPFGAPLALYQHSSSLVDAYKCSEVDAASGLGLFSLTSRISDRAEAAEELRANTVWSLGLPGARVALSLEAVAEFRRAGEVSAETRLNGRRGNYLVVAPLALGPHAATEWHLAADAGRDHVQAAALRARLLEPVSLAGALTTALAAASANLRRDIASADGVQLSANIRTSAHHMANVLFNNMRGGVFTRDHLVPAADFAAFMRTRNRAAAERHAAWLAALPGELPVDQLTALAAREHDADLERLAHEYLPLHFGRRHGDPSRPWNRFSIRLREADGTRALRYEGNWRDIFQNWEALAASFPGFLPSLVAKFVNASTVDGFNPYRVSREGIDWEVEEPGHPWSNIGYWGDHQLIYLLKFLEAWRETEPGALARRLDQAIFAYAQVPYRLAPFDKILANPRATITFDHALAARIDERVRAHGSDGRLLGGADGRVLHVTLFEKLLVPVLSKLSNFVPEAGIWMNTQRPEWNDANNALVGYGVSVVTLAHLRRTLAFLLELFSTREHEAIAVSREVVRWAREVRTILEQRAVAPYPGALGDRERLETMTALGTSFTRYRETVQEHGFSGAEPFPVADAVALLRTALAHTEHALAANAREDGLYHSYNLLAFARDGRSVSVQRLPEMLEGQVAALSSGLVTPEETVRLLDRMYTSRLFRADQNSFMLYPERDLPGFLEKNRVPDTGIAAVPLLTAMLAAGETTIVARDAAGVHRFAAGLSNAAALDGALARLELDPRWRQAVTRDRQAVLDLYESVFRHHSFTGRSGTMYGYEGIGSIYWHMVAKLLLALQEVHTRALRADAPAPLCEALAQHYEHVRAGLGSEKSAEQYGAFPTDPYSHTPARRGARQPGMTGQVKEEILARFGELGVRVEAGRIVFRPRLLRLSEFLTAPGVLQTCAPGGRPQTVEIPAGALGFTYCSVPIRYVLTNGSAQLRVTDRGGRVHECAGDTLGERESAMLLRRSGEVVLVEVSVPRAGLRADRPLDSSTGARQYVR